ncbi:hypothetical protein ACFXAF_00270 [Kitasatospora sp. NPDC059463]|uniref:hypothetical protein n=1 Tax=unclassified Kitasatospora TaxID=2633591 RepID=UPI0036783C41
MIAGRGPAPALVLALVQRLPDTSLTAALAAGGRHLLGWGQDRHLIADLYDAINLNTRATGQWGRGKAPKIPSWPRPAAKDRRKSTGDAKPPKTVAAIYQQLTGR